MLDGWERREWYARPRNLHAYGGLLGENATNVCLVFRRPLCPCMRSFSPHHTPRTSLHLADVFAVVPSAWQGLPGGHLCHITSPEAFSQAVTEYLLDVPVPS